MAKDRSAYFKAYYEKNRALHAERVKRWAAANSESARARSLKWYRSERGKRQRLKPYGLTIEQYEKMYADQRGCCMGCRRSFASLKREPDIDHDHATGRVRGLLCHSCNLVLGLVRDEKETLFGLIVHLENAEGVFA